MPSLPCSLHCILKWECKLPRKYIIAACPRPRSLGVKVEIQTTDTAEVRAGPALIDSRATSLFMSWGYVKCHRLTTWKLQHSIVVYNVDGLLNEARSITEVVNAILHVNRHTK